MSDTSIDVEAVLVAVLDGAGFTVYGVELPEGWQDSLPAVRVVALPARETARAWNGPGLLSTVDVDIDVFGGSLEAVADAAASVREVLDRWSSAAASVTSAPAFSSRPDWNQRIRRRGAVLSLVTR